jgi:hypothetical protein
MTNITKEIKKEYPVLKMEGVGKLIIRENVKKKIDIIHKTFGNLEWSGVLFYNKLEGSISDPSTYVAEVVDIYPMNKGTSGYTEFNFDGEQLLEMADRVDAYMTSRTGLIHSHWGMKAFFSGEDLDELHTNVENYSKNGSYYLSLIVNFEEKYVAKIVKLVEVPEANILIEEEGTDRGSIKTFSKQMMFMMDLNIEIENSPEDKELMNRLQELEEQARAKAAKVVTTQTINGKQHQVNRSLQNSLWGDEWEDFNKSGNKSIETWEEPYKINPTTIRKNLNQILTLDTENKMETGRILADMFKMSEKEREGLFDDIEVNVHLMTIDMFGYDKLTEALQETHKLLNTYRTVTLWKNVIEGLNEIFEAAIEYSEYVIEEEDLVA